MRNLLFLIAALIFLPFITSAQLHISPRSTFYATAGTPLNFDSLIIVPDVSIVFSNLTIDKNYEPILGNSGRSVSRVYTISTPVEISGIVGMYVSDDELNGNILSDLQIAYDPGSGFITTGTSGVNSAENMVSNNFIPPVYISKLTATSTGIVLPIKLRKETPAIFTVYPNPATDNVFAELSGNERLNASLILTDLSGRIVMKMPFSQKKISFNIAHLPSGIYFANYSDGENKFSFKLSKL